MRNPIENTTALYAYLKTYTGKLTRAEFVSLFHMSCGYLAALRDLGLKTGDPRYNDATVCHMEIHRITRERFNLSPNGWRSF